jgi:hypothetical protein
MTIATRKAFALFALTLVGVFGCSSERDVLPPGERSSGDAGAADAGAPYERWSFVVLPDTQYYSGEYAPIFEMQTRWIARARESYGIRFVLHVGDVTDDDSIEQWSHARSAMQELGDIPYAIAPGNHDYEFNAWTRTTRMNDFFPVSMWQDQGTFAGSFAYGDSTNTAQIFDTPEGPWLVLALEFGPRPLVAEWAAEVLKENEGVHAAVVTHAYLYSDGTRYDIEKRSDQPWNPHEYGVAYDEGGVLDGEEMFRTFIEPDSDVELVLAGHVHDNGGAARLTDERTDGTLVHQLLSNYQAGPRGGSGYLRIVRVFEDRFVVETYSPFLNEYKRDPANDFTVMRR